MLKVVFMGTPDFAVPSLQNLIESSYDIQAVVTQPDRPKGRKRILTPPPVKEVAVDHDIPVYQPEKLKQSEELQHLLALQPDLIVTAAYGQMLPQTLLEAPRFGCMNVHASLLPQYRGGAPIHKAIMDGQTKTGVTIMYMVKAMDAGDIIRQVEVDIEQNDDVGSLHDKLSEAGAQLLLDTIPALVTGDIQPRPQNEDEVTYAYNITRDDERIDWQKSSTDIYNHVRGLRPFPVAFTELEGKVIKVWRVSFPHTQPPKSSGLKPGTIYDIAEDGIDVVTGDGAGLSITELQPSGKKRMSVADYVRGSGQQLKVGMSFK